MTDAKHLRHFVSVDGGMEAELKHRLGEVAEIMGGLPSLWNNRGVNTDEEVGVL